MSLRSGVYIFVLCPDGARNRRWQYPEGDLGEQELPTCDVNDPGGSKVALNEALILQVHHCVKPSER